MKHSIAIYQVYDDLASSYDTRWAGYLNATYRQVLKFLKPKNTDHILDISCGTGLLAMQILRHSPQASLVLVDYSKKMLSIAKQRLKKYNNIRFINSKIEHTKLNSHTYDKILSVSAFHYYRDPDQALHNIHQALQRDGELILVDWCNDPFYFQIYDFLLRIIDRAHFKTYTTKEIISLLQQHNFKIKSLTKWHYHWWSLMTIRAKLK